LSFLPNCLHFPDTSWCPLFSKTGHQVFVRIDPLPYVAAFMAMVRCVRIIKKVQDKKGSWRFVSLGRKGTATSGIPGLALISLTGGTARSDVGKWQAIRLRKR